MQTDSEVPIAEAAPLQNAVTVISKYQRALLLKMHKEGNYTDTVIRKVEREMDINELKMDSKLPPIE